VCQSQIELLQGCSDATDRLPASIGDEILLYFGENISEDASRDVRLIVSGFSAEGVLWQDVDLASGSALGEASQPAISV